MPGVVFDTNIYIGYKPTNLPASLFLSSVVLQELIAGASDAEEVKRYAAAKRQFEKDGKFLVPTGADWFLAGKVINSLIRGLKSKSGGITPKLHPDEKSRIVRDVLIARAAISVGALLVTNYSGDFQRIKRFCKVRLQSGSEYFRKKPDAWTTF